MRIALLLASVLISSAFGNSISYVDLFHTQLFTQTGAAQPTTPQYYFAADVNMENPADFNAATITPFGGSVMNMTLNAGGLSFGLSSSVFSDLATFDSLYPTGMYSFTATDSTNANPDSPQTVGNAAYSDAFGTAIPFVTDYVLLSGLNTANPFVVTWNPFAGALTGGNNSGLIFFDIFNHSTGVNVFSQAFLPGTTTSATIAGMTLAPNTQYDFQLVFSNRQIGTYSFGGADFNPLLGSDLRTSGSFTTGAAAAPEPSTFFVIGAGLAALLATRCRSLIPTRS